MPDESLTKEAVINDLLQTLSDESLAPEVAAKLVSDKLTPEAKVAFFKQASKTPAGSARKSALDMLSDVDELLKDPNKILVYAYEDRPNLKEDSLYIYITSGFKYICDYFDDDTNKYKNLRAKVEIKPHKERDGKVRGVWIVPKAILAEKPKARVMSIEQMPDFLTYHETVNGADQSDYKKIVMDWIESIDLQQKPLELNNLHLNEQQVSDMESLLDSIQEKYAGVVKQNMIRIIRMQE